MVAFLARVEGAAVYDNVTTPLVDTNGIQLAHYSAREFGDEINLAGNQRIITDFLFEYYGDFTQALGKTARLRFYQNDGPGRYPAPQTLLYDSGAFFLGTGYNTKWLSGINVTVPDTFTWTVEFSGLTGQLSDRAGLLFYHPPTLGSSARDFWERIDGLWVLSHFGGSTFKPEANFGARVIAVPEPAVWILAALGGLGLFGRWRRS